MKTDTALSGKEAIEKIKKKHYDVIFMDHMMPEMDGVETTRIIRESFRDYDDVPIIALTANAMEESRSMLLVEGMNDFIAKPIEIRVTNLIHDLGVPAHIKGYQFLREAIILAVENEEMINAVTKIMMASLSASRIASAASKPLIPGISISRSAI